MNVLLIIADQHRADHMSCVGNQILKTPNLDKLASEGVRFTSAYVANPICMPNRASIFTGLYPNMHGIRTAGMNMPESTPTFTETLRKNGYHTVEIGKIHLNWSIRPFDKNAKSNESARIWITKDNRPQLPLPYYGFEEVDLIVGHGDICGGHYMDWLEEKGPEYIPIIRKKAKTFFAKPSYRTEIPEELYPTTYITERSLAFLKRFAKGDYGDKPFFLNISYPDPHHPVCPPGRYKDMYSPEDIELPSNFKDGENLLNHEFLGEILRDSRFPHLLPQKVDEEVAKTFISLTYGSIAMIDDGVGKILQTLEETGMADNTMVIFTSDHGDYCGDHGLILKGPAHYRSIINMPLLWKVPEVTKSGVSDSLVNTVDLPKTILNILGVKEKLHPEAFQGYDITPILNDPNKKVRERVLIEHDEEIAADRIFRVRTLITERHRLSLYDDYVNMGEIFDYESDPSEIDNLWSKDRELKNKLVEEQLREIIHLRPRLPKRDAYN